MLWSLFFKVIRKTFALAKTILPSYQVACHVSLLKITLRFHPTTLCAHLGHLLSFEPHSHYVALELLMLWKWQTWGHAESSYCFLFRTSHSIHCVFELTQVLYISGQTLIACQADVFSLDFIRPFISSGGMYLKYKSCLQLRSFTGSPLTLERGPHLCVFKLFHNFPTWS